MTKLTFFFLALFLLITLITSSDLQIRTIPTPIDQQETILEILFTRDFDSKTSYDFFTLNFLSSLDENDSPFNHLTFSTLTLTATLNGLAEPITDGPSIYTILPTQDGTGFYVDSIGISYSRSLRKNENIRFFCKIAYKKISPTILNLLNQGGLDVSLIFTNAPKKPTTDSTDSIESLHSDTDFDQNSSKYPQNNTTDDPDYSETVKTSILFVPSIPQTQEIHFSYIDFPNNPNTHASYFSLRFPNNSILFNRVSITPYGFWQYLAADEPLYCFIDGIFVSHGQIPDTFGEYSFFFTTPLEYPDDWSIPDRQDTVIDCLFSGSIIDRDHFDEFEPEFGFLIGFPPLLEPLSLNMTSILLKAPKVNQVESDGSYLTPVGTSIEERLAMLRKKSQHKSDDKNDDKNEDNNDDKMNTKFPQVKFNFQRVKQEMFQFMPYWWRGQTLLNQPKDQKSQESGLGGQLISTFGYLYLLSPRDGVLNNWDEKKHENFVLKMEFFPKKSKITHFSYSLGCYSDAPQGQKSIDIHGFGDITYKLNTSHISAKNDQNLDQNLNNNFEHFSTDPITPYFNYTRSDGTKIICNPKKSDGMLYVTLQIEHTVPFPMSNPESEKNMQKKSQNNIPPNFPSPYPILWLHVSEGLTAYRGSDALVPYIRQNGNMLDSNPKPLVQDLNDFQIFADRLEIIEKNEENVGELDIYSIRKITIGPLLTSTSYLAVFLPDGKYSFGTNKTQTENNVSLREVIFEEQSEKFQHNVYESTSMNHAVRANSKLSTLPGVTSNQLECYIETDKKNIKNIDDPEPRELISVNGYLNYTTEIVFNFEFVKDTTYTIICPQDTSPLWLIPTDFYKKQNQNFEQNQNFPQIEITKMTEIVPKNIMVILHSIPTDFAHGGVSTANKVYFYDEEAHIMPLWKKILLVSCAIAVLLLALTGISVLCACFCTQRDEYNEQINGDFKVDDGEVHQIQSYGSMNE